MSQFVRFALFAFFVASLVVFSEEASALDIPWDGSGTPPFGTNNDSWQNVDNWTPVGSPFSVHRVPGDLDVANLSSPTNDTIRLYADTEPINGLNLSNSVNLFTEDHNLLVNNANLFESAATAIAGVGTLLQIAPPFGAVSNFETDRLLMGNSGRLTVLNGGRAFVYSTTTLTSGSSIFMDDTSLLSFSGNVTAIDSNIEAFDSSSALLFGENITVDLQSSGLLLRNNRLNLNSGQTIEATGSTIGSRGASLSAGGTVRVSGSSSFDLQERDILIDGGTLEVNTMSTVDSIENLTLINGGVISGSSNLTLRMNSDSTTEERQWSVHSGASVALPAGKILLRGESLEGGRLDVGGAGTSFGVGDLNIVASLGGVMFSVEDSATAMIGDLSLSSDGDPGDISFAGATFSDQAQVTVSGDLHVGVTSSSGPSLARGTSLVVGSDASLLQSGSGTTQVGNNFAGVPASLQIENGGSFISNSQSFLVEVDASLAVVGGQASGMATIGGPLTVKGTVLIERGAVPNSIADGELHLQAPTIVDSGVVTLREGVLTANAITLINSGTFSFEGGKFSATAFNGDLMNSAGVVAPGTTSVGDGPGNMAIVGDYTATIGSSIEIEIGGTTINSEYDFLDIANNFGAGGDLLFSLIDGFVPEPSDSFTVINAGNLVGLFDNVSPGARLDTSDGGGSFVVNYGVTSPFDPDQVVLSDFQMTANADFDNDVDVDGTDFLLIQRTDPSLIPLWQSQYGTNPLAAGVAVPEPTTGMLVIAAALSLHFARKEAH